MSRSGRAVRAWRGGAAAAIATFFATVSHTAADGHLPSWWGVALAFALATPVCVLLATRGFSWWRVSAAVLLSQALFHAILTLDLTATGAAPSMHLHGGMPTATATAVTSAAHLAVTPAMWLAHVIAAVCTVLVLGRGEQAARALWQLLSIPFLLLLASVSAPIATRSAPVAATTHRILRGLSVLSVMRRRGPPLAA